jgi:hypothetical protein
MWGRLRGGVGVARPSFHSNRWVHRAQREARSSCSYSVWSPGQVSPVRVGSIDRGFERAHDHRLAPQKLLCASGGARWVASATRAFPSFLLAVVEEAMFREVDSRGSLV